MIGACEQGNVLIDSEGNLWGAGNSEFLCQTNGFGSVTWRILLPEHQSKFIMVATGERHALILDEFKKVWAFGYGAKGELFNGFRSPQPTIIHPESSIICSPIQFIAAGRECSIVIDESGNGWSVGNNLHGQLGIGYFGSDPLDLTPIVGDQQWVQVAMSSRTTLLLTRNGSVWSCGAAVNSTRKIPTPIMIPMHPKENIYSVSAGSDHFLLLSSKGIVYGLGSNSKGQLGLGSRVLIKDQPTVISGLSEIVSVCCGANHSLALARDSMVRVFGNNVRNQIGRFGPVVWEPQCFSDNLANPIREIYAGNDCSFYVNTSGEIYFTGSNAILQCLDSPQSYFSVSTLIPNFTFHRPFNTKNARS